MLSRLLFALHNWPIAALRSSWFLLAHLDRLQKLSFSWYVTAHRSNATLADCISSTWSSGISRLEVPFLVILLDGFGDGGHRIFFNTLTLSHLDGFKLSELA